VYSAVETPQSGYPVIEYVHYNWSTYDIGRKALNLRANFECGIYSKKWNPVRDNHVIQLSVRMQSAGCQLSGPGRGIGTLWERKVNMDHTSPIGMRFPDIHNSLKYFYWAECCTRITKRHQTWPQMFKWGQTTSLTGSPFCTQFSHRTAARHCMAIRASWEPRLFLL
jgi:hypothetical protein